MREPLDKHQIRAAFLTACRAELEALKPGNVHRHASGHGMEVAHFERAAEAAAGPIADASLSVGQRILRATEVSVGAGKEEQAIPSTQFFTEDNQPGGLTGRYFSGENFETNISTQIDAQINFSWNPPPAPLPR